MLPPAPPRRTSIQDPHPSGNRTMSTIPASFLSGPNAPFIEELYAKYVESPSSVDPSWRKFFSELQDESATVLQDIRGASWAPRLRSVEIGNGHDEPHANGDAV